MLQCSVWGHGGNGARIAFKAGQTRKMRQHARPTLRLVAKYDAYLPNNHEQDAPRIRRCWLS
jgi:hypothetical protein